MHSREKIPLKRLNSTVQALLGHDQVVFIERWSLDTRLMKQVSLYNYDYSYRVLAVHSLHRLSNLIATDSGDCSNHQSHHMYLVCIQRYTYIYIIIM